MRFAIAIDDPAHVEVTVIGFIAEVAANGVHPLAVHGSAQGHVVPAPDVAADQAWMLFDHVPISLKVAEDISAGMGVFVQQKWLS